MSANINFQRVDSPVAFEGAQIAIDCICNQNNSKTIFESGKLHNFHLEFQQKNNHHHLFDLKEIANGFLVRVLIELCNKIDAHYFVCKLSSRGCVQ